MHPTNRISKYLPSPAAPPVHPERPRCKTTRIGHRDERMSVLDVLGAVGWVAAVVGGVVTVCYLLGVAFGAGFRMGIGL